jgi:predicted phage terminase large subunit-like protein
MGPTAAARGLANRPVSGDICPFKEQHFQGPPPLAADRYQRRSFFADPAGDSTKARTSDTDFCSVVAVGLHPEDKVWEVYLAARIRGSPSRQAEFIARMALQAKAQVVWQEAIKDEALVGVTQDKLKELGAYIPVRPEKPTTHKELRIVQTLEPALAAGQLRICGRAFPELREEALTFPAAAHDDLVDALAGAFGKAQVSGVMRHFSSVMARAKDADPVADEERRRRARFRHRIWHRRGRIWDD